jgi:hypothetical protein
LLETPLDQQGLKIYTVAPVFANALFSVVKEGGHVEEVEEIETGEKNMVVWVGYSVRRYGRSL